MRITIATSLLAIGLCAAACDKFGLGGGGGTPTSPTGPPAAGSHIVYAIVGASDAIGYGSSKPCLPFEDCDGQGYAWVAARQLRAQGFTVEIAPYGIPTSVISRQFQDLAAQAGRTDILANMLQQEMPFVRKDSTVVTVFTGANDVNVITSALGKGLGGSNPTAYIDQWVDAFGADFSSLIAGIHDRAPGARVIVMNLPNLAALPYKATAPLAEKQAAQRAAVRITTTIVNARTDITVIDLMCDARLYQSSMFSSDGFHPNDSGYAVLGAEIVKALTSSSYPAPKNSCSQMTLY